MSKNKYKHAWVRDALSRNPNYCGWSPGGDYMNGKGWEGNGEYETWNDFRGSYGDPEELNECVNFYFHVDGWSSIDYDFGDKDDRRAHYEADSVSLNLWIIHPRKGASKGVAIKRLNEDDFRKAVDWLALAAASNAKRFAGVAK